MNNTARVRQTADRIRVIVAETLERRIKDPRLGFVTVTDAKITNDLREATVFYTVLSQASRPAETQPAPPAGETVSAAATADAAEAATAAALESARGMLRTEVGRRLGLRHAPSLAFVLDAVPDNARHIEELLDRARYSDARVHQVAKGASHAGDPDPYRRPADEDDSDGDEAVEAVAPAGDDDAGSGDGQERASR